LFINKIILREENMKKFLSMLLILILVLGMMAGCTTDQPAEEPAEEPAEGSDEEPAEEPSEKDFEVTVGLAGDTLALDPYVYNETISNAVLQHMYEALILTDNDLNNVPGLAKDWELSDDLMTWTFYLREGVEFHNGNEFNADDVIYSFDRAQEPFSKWTNVFGTVESYEKVDEYTVVVNSSSPDVIFLSKLRDLVILDKETFEGKGEDFVALNTNGTGKYKLEEHVKEDRIVFVRNEDYWGEKPQVTKVTYKPITNDATRTANIMTGDVDMVVDVPVRDVEILKTNDDLNIIQQPSLRNIYLNFAGWTDNPSPDAEAPMISPDGSNPFQELEVRQAMYHAINVQEISDKIMNGFSTPAASYSPVTYVGYNPDIEIPEHDPELAKQLLDDAGYPVQDSGELEGYRFQVTLDASNDRYINDAQIAQAIAGYLERVGIKVNLNLMSRNIFFTYIRGTNPMGDITHFLMSGWSDSSGEGVTLASDLLYSHNQDSPVKEGFGGVNRGYYKNEEVDALIDEALATREVEKRDELIQEVWKIASEEVAYIPIHFQQDVFATNSKIDYNPRPNKYIYAWDIEVLE